jgi:hypothetical protein
MEANVLDISLFEMLLGDISYGTAADDVICHNKTPFRRYCGIKFDSVS